MTLTALLQILASIVLSVGAQSFLKTGVSRAAPDDGLGTFYLSVMVSPYTLLGLVLFLGSLAFWFRALSQVPLSQAYPFTALGVVITVAIGIFVFGETITAARIAAVMLIASGLVLLAFS